MEMNFLPFGRYAIYLFLAQAMLVYFWQGIVERDILYIALGSGCIILIAVIELIVRKRKKCKQNEACKEYIK